MDEFLGKPIIFDELRALLARFGAAPPEAMPAPMGQVVDSVLDEATIANLQKMRGVSGPSLLVEVVELFFQSTPADIVRLEEAAGRRDAPETARLAHALAGSCGSAGAKELRRVLLEFERAVREGDWPLAQKQFAHVRPEWERARAALEKKANILFA